MDTNFLQWMQLHHSERYSSQMFGIVRTEFMQHNLATWDFSDGDELMKHMVQMSNQRSLEVRTLLCSKDNSICETKTESVSLTATTIYIRLLALRWYTKFLGFSHVELDMYIRKTGARSTNYQHGRLLEMIFDPTYVFHRYNRIILFLRSMQHRAHEYMTAIINMHGTYTKTKLFFKIMSLVVGFFFRFWSCCFVSMNTPCEQESSLIFVCTGTRQSGLRVFFRKTIRTRSIIFTVHCTVHVSVTASSSRIHR